MSDASSALPDIVDVLVVGGGPTGMTIASLLGTYGLRVALIEKNEGTSDEAKAISLDDESLRALQAAGLDGLVYPIIVPGTGTRYYDSSAAPLFHARGPKVRRHGHPFKNPFAQPDLEAALAEGLRSQARVSAHYRHELLSLAESDSDVVAQVATPSGRRQVRSSFLLGCDGGRSTVRQLLAIAMEGRSFPELWLVADTLGDSHDERYGMHVGDPRLPHVIVPGLNGRCRYEFKLRPGEAEPGANPPFELVARLVARYRTLTPEQLERSVVYGFHAILASSFGTRRSFLLGDAAHMMPPFAGQGLNSGIRDAMNLAWKVAAVHDGRADLSLLTTYETERKPHARATIALSVRLGEVAMTSNRLRASVRDVLVRTAMRVPAGRRYLTEMRYRPRVRVETGFVVRHSEDDTLVGTSVPQTMVLDGRTNESRRLDDVIGTGAAVIGVGVTLDDWDVVRPLAATWAARTVDMAVDDRAPRTGPAEVPAADVEGSWESPQLRGRFVLVRPDRIAAAVFRADEAGSVSTALARFGFGTARPARDASSAAPDHQSPHPPSNQSVTGTATPNEKVS